MSRCRLVVPNTCRATGGVGAGEGSKQEKGGNSRFLYRLRRARDVRFNISS